MQVTSLLFACTHCTTKKGRSNRQIEIMGEKMFDLASYEILFFSGIIVMVAVVVCLLIFLVIHFCRGIKLRRMLDEEYGDPRQYNRGNVRKS